MGCGQHLHASPETQDAAGSKRASGSGQTGAVEFKSRVSISEDAQYEGEEFRHQASDESKASISNESDFTQVPNVDRDQRSERSSGKSMRSSFSSHHAGGNPAEELCSQVHGPDDVLAMVDDGVVCLFGTTKEASSGSVDPVIEREAEKKPLYVSEAAAVSDSFWQSVAVNCVKARKPTSPNQDNVFLCRMDGVTLCGVADGHGEHGHWVSSWVVEFVLYLWITEVHYIAKLPDDATIRWLFGVTHQALMLRAGSKDLDLAESGSTLTLCFLDHIGEKALTAWVGDSRCVRGHGSEFLAESLSDDHKPENIGERSRILSHGGRVSMFGTVEEPTNCRSEPSMRMSKISSDPTECSGLSMSRSLGDALYHTVGVIHDPEIRRVPLRDPSGEQTQFILCCSDGIWEFVTNEEAVRLVGNFGRNNAEYAAETLLQLARLRWLDKLSGRRTDDISVVVVWL